MSRKKPILLAAAIVLAAAAFYLPAVDAGFIWDDDHFLTLNPLIRARDGLYRFWFTTAPRDYFPLTSSMLWVEWRLWGMDPTGYHVVNILLHAAAAALVWRVLKRLNVPGAWLAGLLFAVHPVNVPSVAWIAERKNALSLPLYLLSALLYMRFEDLGGARRYAASLALFLLALLSKTSVVMLPVVLLGCAWWRRGALTRRDVFRLLPFFALALAAGLVEMWFHAHRVLPHLAARPEGFFSRLAAAGWAVWFYLYKAVLPLDLAMVYPRWRVDPREATAWLPLAILIGCLAFVWMRRRSSWGRPVLFAAGCFIASLFPVLGFFDISFMRHSLVADHWQYAAIIGVIALAAAAGVRGRERLRGAARSAAVVGAVILIGALGVLTWRQCALYQDAETLWRDTLSKNPRCWAAHTNLATALLARGNLQDAVAHYEIATRLEPDFPEAHYNLGNVFFALGDFRRAVEEYRALLRIQPDNAEVRQRLSDAQGKAGGGV